jgi:NCAIR mutase (PurE)-related protein
MKERQVHDPFVALRAALSGQELPGRSNPGVWVDPERAERTGVPEVVLAAGKSDEQLRTSVAVLLEQRGRVLVSRLDGPRCAMLRAAFPEAEMRTSVGGRTAVLWQGGRAPKPTGGRVGILTAGAADLEAADEARLVAEELGCAVRLISDVGVAGLHRLVPALTELIQEWDADVLIVAAGMDGVLPSVVAGLVEVPVIGLPTPVGYGLAGAGVAALHSMLQTCAPGLVVVNIDNGIGAGAAAAKIANRCAAQRALERSVSRSSA